MHHRDVQEAVGRCFRYASLKLSGHLRAILTTGLVGANVLVFSLSGYSLYQSRQQYELRAQAQTENVASALDQSVSGSIEKVDLALRAVVDELERQLADKGIDDAAMAAFVARQEQRLPEVDGFRVAGADGSLMFGRGVNRNDKVTWADREFFIHFRDNMDGSLLMSKPLMGRVVKKYLISFSRRYNYPDGRFAGVVAAL